MLTKSQSSALLGALPLNWSQNFGLSLEPIRTLIYSKREFERIATQRLTAVFVLPPCCVTLGRHFILIAPRVNESSLALLDQTYASPVPRLLIFSAVNSPRAALAFWMCLSQAGELNLCMMICDDSSMIHTGTEGGS